MLRRRFLLSSLVSTALLSTACSGKSVPRHVIVSAEKLQQAVAQRFPRQYPVAGLLQLQLQAPSLQLLPESNLIKAQIATSLSGPVLKQGYGGRMEVDFALRYEASDRTVRAQSITVHRLELDGLPPALAEMLSTYGGGIAAQALDGVVLYQMQDKDLALMDALDMQPGAMRVTPQGLEIALDRKPQAR
ncbi:DUF1439 domain-containing protein [Acidovorax sp. Be4]|jgi:hypothetical protein|uniref:DUF1439 domain-containing protein n=1 Tax=Acidovorax bellezanensis TaxID=2976702 RepID=A0ABT2PMB9_9BURK|nr:DUF1439 domain-containing protein [Acidovorax sp. Be4]MCT9811632.1 DUF1439 domain-containing protein [Acidovorax sp. Be4]